MKDTAPWIIIRFLLSDESYDMTLYQAEQCMPDDPDEYIRAQAWWQDATMAMTMGAEISLCP